MPGITFQRRSIVCEKPYSGFRRITCGTSRGTKEENENSGDITIEHKDRTLLLEVTLIDKNAIKRGEWEPVLRHTVNLSASRTVPVQTYLITDAVDKNTENIWRSVAATDLEETAVQHRSVRATIYPLTIDTLIKWLHDKGVNEKYLALV
ncbi:AlwI family type II restriction endonuclease [Lactobacillus helveticus]|nr:AlwI family type II restriction endonuclease [Lactobacillus helveticus]